MEIIEIRDKSQPENGWFLYQLWGEGERRKEGLARLRLAGFEWRQRAAQPSSVEDWPVWVHRLARLVVRTRAVIRR